jgi:3-dehydroquinate synthetase
MPAGWRSGDFMRALGLDKKRAAGALEFVLLDRLGHSLTKSLAFDDILSPLS